jgi:hypothetical protein
MNLAKSPRASFLPISCKEFDCSGRKNDVMVI